MNVEPSATTADVPQFLTEARRRASEHLMPTVEITERALTVNLAELIALVTLYRRMGWGVALDDVGVDARSVSLMPFIRPDVIKLDMTFVQQEMTRDRARTAHAVVAEAERSGALVLAQGIETPDHLKSREHWVPTSGRGGCLAVRVSCGPASRTRREPDTGPRRARRRKS